MCFELLVVAVYKIGKDMISATTISKRRFKNNIFQDDGLTDEKKKLLVELARAFSNQNYQHYQKIVAEFNSLRNRYLRFC